MGTQKTNPTECGWGIIRVPGSPEIQKLIWKDVSYTYTLMHGWACASNSDGGERADAFSWAATVKISF